MKTSATWIIQLETTCPFCHHEVDLLDDPDFFDGRSRLQVGEHETIESRDLEVCCPMCSEEFSVDLEF